MFEKKYYFLAGLPRAGNTVLSSILNQNSRVQVSANSFVSTIFAYILDQADNLAYQNFPDSQSIMDCASTVFQSYYKSWKGRTIIDRAPWGTDANLRILEQYCPNELKFICPVRDVNKVLASFIFQYYKSGALDVQNEEEVIEYCDELMTREDSHIAKGLWSIRNFVKDEYKDRVYFMHYDDFCDDPQQELNNIYKFLGIRKYKHDFNNIQQYEVNGVRYNDKIDKFLTNLHTVKKTIERSTYRVENILPESVITKYEHLTFDHFRNCH